jgi:hypothetical protein
VKVGVDHPRDGLGAAAEVQGHGRTLADFFQQSVDIPPYTRSAPQRFSGILQDLCFSFDPKSSWIIKNISLPLKKEQGNFLFGKKGSEVKFHDSNLKRNHKNDLTKEPFNRRFSGI